MTAIGLEVVRKCAVFTSVTSTIYIYQESEGNIYMNFNQALWYSTPKTFTKLKSRGLEEESKDKDKDKSEM